MLVNPTQVRKIPGRKTDVIDAQWIAQLLECGLLHGSFVSPEQVRDLRGLTVPETTRSGPGPRIVEVQKS